MKQITKARAQVQMYRMNGISFERILICKADHKPAIISFGFFLEIEIRAKVKFQDTIQTLAEIGKLT